MENAIQDNKDIVYSNTQKKMYLETKIKSIEAAEQDAISCISCNTINYLVDITENEVKSK